MRKLFTMLMLGAAVFAFTGCKKSDEQKAKDAAEQMQKDAGKAADSMKKDADKAADDAKEKLDGILGK